MMKYLLPLAAIVAQGYCAESIDDRVSKLETDMKIVRTGTAFGNYGAKTASANPQNDGYGFFITGDFLWWKLYEGGDEYAIERRTPSKSAINGKVETLNFKWEPGFKVGAGYDMEHDGWDIFFNFTYYTTRADTTKHTGEKDDLITILGLSDTLASEAKARWHVHFYDLDATIGRNFFVSKSLALHPSVGITSAWISQKSHVDYTLPSSHLIAKSRNDFWGIGPRLGLNTRFYLGKNFSVYGDAAAALLWGDFTIKETEFEAVPFIAFDSTKGKDLHRIAPTLGFCLGLAYETNFYQDRYHILIKLGYETQYWWRQNQLPHPYVFSFSYDRYSEDLSLLGLTLDVRFDF
jgi:hypothetical protein